MIKISSKVFEQLLSKCVGRSDLALDIDITEMSSSDLVEVVRISDLRSKYQLADALSGFSDVAMETAHDLQRLNATISESVDKCVLVSFLFEPN